MIASILALYVCFGVLSFWPFVRATLNSPKGPWYEWLAAWVFWSICWPIRYVQDLWYWWRAKK